MIIFPIKRLNSPIWPMVGILNGTNTLSQSIPGSNGNEGYSTFPKLQDLNLTWESSTSYPGHNMVSHIASNVKKLCFNINWFYFIILWLSSHSFAHLFFPSLNWGWVREFCHYLSPHTHPPRNWTNVFLVIVIQFKMIYDVMFDMQLLVQY